MSLPTVGALADRLNDLAGSVAGLAGIQAAIQFVVDNHLEDWEVPISETEQTAFLKSLTGSVVVLDPAVNCYPVGLSTTILFDENGDRIP